MGFQWLGDGVGLGSAGCVARPRGSWFVTESKPISPGENFQRTSKAGMHERKIFHNLIWKGVGGSCSF